MLKFKLNLIWEFTPGICVAELNLQDNYPALSLFFLKLKEDHIKKKYLLYIKFGICYKMYTALKSIIFFYIFQDGYCLMKYRDHILCL
jgi:hypothetical protein